MIVTSNTSPIINLAAVGKLELLNQLYGNIYIPKAVNSEIDKTNKAKFPVIDIKNIEWINVTSISNKELIAALNVELDDGESEAIALSVEKKADILLIDERRGRKIADRFNIKYIGLLGILLESKQKGFVQKLNPILYDLISKAGFWMSHNLIQRVLKEAGE